MRAGSDFCPPASRGQAFSPAEIPWLPRGRKAAVAVVAVAVAVVLSCVEVIAFRGCHHYIFLSRTSHTVRWLGAGRAGVGLRRSTEHRREGQYHEIRLHDNDNDNAFALASRLVVRDTGYITTKSNVSESARSLSTSPVSRHRHHQDRGSWRCASTKYAELTKTFNMSASKASMLPPNTAAPGAHSPARVSMPPGAVNEAGSSDVEEELTSDEGKTGKRRLFGFGKKKKDTKKKETTKANASLAAGNNSTTVAQPVVGNAPVESPQRHPSDQPYPASSSPHPKLFSSSPRPVSPAGSQIFERDVQESALPVATSPAIPSHIQTENHIPPVLDASSEAITSRVDPDTVEIVTHSSHQPATIPASMSATGVGSLEPSGGNASYDASGSPEKDDATSYYGSLDSPDIKRLSFISFSDIVQSEHAEHAGSKDPIYVAGLSSLSSGHNRSPSPIRSPVSSQGLGTSPPTSQSASLKGIDMSTKGRPLGSPTSTLASLGSSELTIETMTQALRRTGSADLSGARSQPLSPSSPGLGGLSDKSLR